jgi:hypothetical protein
VVVFLAAPQADFFDVVLRHVAADVRAIGARFRDLAVAPPAVGVDEWAFHGVWLIFLTNPDRLHLPAICSIFAAASEVSIVF